MEIQRFTVQGISCGSCVAKIDSALNNEPGLSGISVSRSPDRIEFSSEKRWPSNKVNQLLDELSPGKYKTFEQSNEISPLEASPIKKLFPLALVISYLVGIVALIAFLTSDFSMASIMSHYMGGFFLIFSFFKFLNINGFADAFSTYDPIAKAWRPYGYFYALFELIAGATYLMEPTSITLNAAALIVLSISSWGVIKAVRSKQTIQCACLGTVFNLPMTKVTIIENVTMILMAGATLVL